MHKKSKDEMNEFQITIIRSCSNLTTFIAIERFILSFFSFFYRDKASIQNARKVTVAIFVSACICSGINTFVSGNNGQRCFQREKHADLILAAVITQVLLVQMVIIPLLLVPVLNVLIVFKLKARKPASGYANFLHNEFLFFVYGDCLVFASFQHC